MIEQHAIVLTLELAALETEAPTHQSATNQSIATLEIVRQTACGLCGQTRGCGNSLWGKLFGHKSANFKAQNLINAKVGDHVIVGIDESALMKSALLLYIAPLATMLFGAILASRVVGSEAASLLGAVAGLLLGFIWVKGHTAGGTYFQQHQPKILRLDNTEASEKIVRFQ